jgi:hypothetical protein
MSKLPQSGLSVNGYSQEPDISQEQAANMGSYQPMFEQYTFSDNAVSQNVNLLVGGNEVPSKQAQQMPNYAAVERVQYQTLQLDKPQAVPLPHSPSQDIPLQYIKPQPAVQDVQPQVASMPTTISSSTSSLTTAAYPNGQQIKVSPAFVAPVGAAATPAYEEATRQSQQNQENGTFVIPGYVNLDLQIPNANILYPNQIKAVIIDDDLKVIRKGNGNVSCYDPKLDTDAEKVS